jgi:hypothetical protein
MPRRPQISCKRDKSTRSVNPTRFCTAILVVTIVVAILGKGDVHAGLAECQDGFAYLLEVDRVDITRSLVCRQT